MSGRKSRRLQEFVSKKQLNNEIKGDKTRSFEYDPSILKYYSFEERRNLINQINRLSAYQISKAVDIVKSNEATTSKDLKDDISINLVKYKNSTINLLEIHLNKCLKDNKIQSSKRDQYGNFKEDQFSNLKKDQNVNLKRDQYGNLKEDQFSNLKKDQNVNLKRDHNVNLKRDHNSNLKKDQYVNLKEKLVGKKTKMVKKIKEEPVDQYFDSQSAFVTKKSNSCNGHNKLANNICYVCGHYKTMYKITETAKKGYKKLFNKVVNITDYSPSMICGTCRCNLSDANHENSIRKFKFIEPLIWRRGTNHDEKSSECDCYFDLLIGNKRLITNKIYPENSTCSMPKFVKPIQSTNDSVDVKVNKVNLDKEIFAGKSFNLNNKQQQQKSTESENIRPASKYMSYNTYSSMPQLYDKLESIKEDTNYLTNQLHQVHESNNFLCNKIDDKVKVVIDKNEVLEKKIDELHQKLSTILTQQDIIIQNAALTFLNSFANQTTNVLNQLDNNQINPITIEPLNLSKNNQKRD